MGSGTGRDHLVGEPSNVVTSARAALARHDWRGAYDLLLAVVGQVGGDRGEELPVVDPDPLECFAEAAWWVARLDECIAARERLYRACTEQGSRRRAARAAMLLSDNYGFRGQPSIAGAWLARARRLLADEADCLERGWLAIREAESAHARGDIETAGAHAAWALDLARRIDDPDLEAEGLQCLGRLRIVAGHPSEGLALYDEAMLLAKEGRLSPFMVGKVHCSLISACEELGDLRRAAEWTTAGASWAASHPASAFPGLCRVHRAALLQMQGEWEHAEAEARRACDELRGVNAHNTALSYREIGDVRRRAGDLDGAIAAYRAAADLGLQPQPGMALVRLAQGRVAVAARMIQQALGEIGHDDLGRARLLPAAVQIGVAADDLDAARAAADELDRIAHRYPSSLIEASAVTSRGRLQLAEGEPAAATASLRRALQAWQQLGVPYEAALTQALLGEAAHRMGDDDEAATCTAAAAATFQRLGAVLDVARLGATAAPVAPRTGPLTDREAEMLCLVAAGLTNRAIAVELCVSEKTVERHLSNVFRKLGVSSRAAASVYAVQLGIAGAGRGSSSGWS